MAKPKLKLYILRPIDHHAGPWDPWYDKAFGFVVCASSEEEARTLAGTEGGDEIEGRWGDTSEVISPWLDPALATCELLVAGGVARVVMRDFCAA